MEQVKQIISELSDEEATTLLYDWIIWARKEQLAPETDFFVWLILTGRGWGKTRSGAEWVIKRVAEGYKRIAIVGQTKADVRDTMIEIGDSALMRIAPPWLMPRYVPSNRRLIWDSGAVAMIYSGDEPDQLRGPQHDSAWVDELAKFKYPQETWDNLEMGMRLSDKPQVVVTTTPRPIPIIKQLVKDSGTYTVRGSIFENKANLPPVFLERMRDKYEGTRLGKQELSGEILEETPGALWHLKSIDALRVKEVPDLIRVVVAIDPSVTSKKDSAEAGIVCAGLGADRHAYVLDDKSIRATPEVWASIAIQLYYTRMADKLIVEINNGGELVESVIRTKDKNIAYKAIHASKGKRTRAEPISALYEQGKVHHVGIFAELEDQMCSWVPGDESPDRMDALVWALTELMLNRTITVW